MKIPHKTAPQKPRPFSPIERGILDQLLSLDFPGRDVLRFQLSNGRVIGGCGCGCRSIDIQVDTSAPRAHTRGRIAVEGVAADADGIEISFLLHVVDGLAVELEILRADSGRIRMLPAAGKLKVY